MNEVIIAIFMILAVLIMFTISASNAEKERERKERERKERERANIRTEERIERRREEQDRLKKQTVEDLAAMHEEREDFHTAMNQDSEATFDKKFTSGLFSNAYYAYKTISDPTLPHQGRMYQVVKILRETNYSEGLSFGTIVNEKTGTEVDGKLLGRKAYGSLSKALGAQNETSWKRV